MSNKTKSSKAGRETFLLITLFCTGAAILVVEVLGARLLSPFFGVGLFVWSALITVTLTALSIGYWWGGRMADQNPSFQRLYFLIFLSGIFVFITPHLSQLLLKSFGAFGVRLGALLAGAVLFGPALLILGMVSPYAVKIYTPELDVLGRRVGHLYAISTIGSCMGAVLTGFVLIPNLGVNAIFYSVAAFLFCLWGIRLIIDKKTKGVIPLIPIGISIFFAATGSAATSLNKKIKLLHKSNSFYGELRVEQQEHQRRLMIDGAPNSGIDVRTGFSLFPYAYYLEIIPYMRPEAKDILVVGLGGGSVSKRMMEYGLNVDTVEIDEEVVRLAKKYFGFKKGTGNIYLQDARHYIRTTEKTYDSIILDVASGDVAPIHLFSVEAIREIKDKLKPGGILGFNYIGFAEGEDTRTTRSIFRTLKEVFLHVSAYPLRDGAVVNNVIYLASTNPLTVAKSLDLCPYKEIRDLMKQMLTRPILKWEETDWAKSKDTLVLTDNYNPVHFWGSRASEEWRKEIWRDFGM